MNNIIEKVLHYLGYDGIGFFEMCLQDYETISPIIKTSYGIPHCVHFREGMQVRNFLRTLDETKNWDVHDFDDNWGDIVQKAINLCHVKRG